MKLEELDQNLSQERPIHKMGTTVVSVISRGHRYIYLSDPVTGIIERRCVDGCNGDHTNVDRQFPQHAMHGLGAVRD